MEREGIECFIFDENITTELDKDDARINFIYKQLESINNILLTKYNSKLLVLKGKPFEVIQNLINKYNVEGFFSNHDYEPYAIARDKKINEFLSNKNINFSSFKDQVIFEKDEVTKDDKTPYVVYTPYMKKWKTKLDNIDLSDFKPKDLAHNFYSNHDSYNWCSLNSFGFEKSTIEIPNYKLDEDLVEKYEKERDFPSLNSTSKIGPHLEGLAGRRSGSLPNYSYSEAMALNNRTSVIWDDRTITAFLTNPQSYYPGTKMIAPPLSYEDALQIGTFLTREKSKNYRRYVRI